MCAQLMGLGSALKILLLPKHLLSQSVLSRDHYFWFCDDFRFVFFFLFRAFLFVVVVMHKNDFFDSYAYWCVLQIFDAR